MAEYNKIYDHMTIIKMISYTSIPCVKYVCSMSSFFEIAQILYIYIYFNENTTYIRRNFFCVLLRIFFFTFVSIILFKGSFLYIYDIFTSFKLLIQHLISLHTHTHTHTQPSVRVSPH